MKKKVIALEARLRDCKNVITLGVLPNFSDYNTQDAKRIKDAVKIYYPSTFYADLFNSMGKMTFPSYNTYKCVQDKIKQTALFNLLDIPHPKTRTFYGNRQKKAILDYFEFPFIGKIPKGSALGRGVYLISGKADLSEYCNIANTAYIQEYIPSDRDIRVVIVGDRVVHAYWRIAAPGDFRSNIALGGKVSLEPVPKQILDLALHTAVSCGWDDVGIDIISQKGELYVIEANMKYGKEGFRAAGINYIQLMETMIENEEI
ncbi:MAG: RimK family alpha-L-glutamate ligase [Deltaproteobacteria bacterium]|nr:RimK family alpha-L-glutamate ligase [Deltaproteobacteria bacterium]